MNVPTATLDELMELDDRRRFLLRTKKCILESKDSLLMFAKYMRPNPQNTGNPLDSVYQVEPHHALIGERLEALERGEIKRLILSVPPRHGKSELASKTFIPWVMGRNPLWSVIMATYNQNFAGDFGRAVRGMLQDPRYAQVFPGIELDPQSKAAERMNLRNGSQMTFVGRGGSLTGRGGHLLLIDDPIKDRKEADSGLIRDQLWSWYTQVFMSRAMVDDVRILLIQTRWHEDDLIGRLTDPHNPSFSHSEAARWEVINLPAFAEDDDPLGRKVGEPLWPKRFGTTYLAGMREQDGRGFSALYQGEPAPDTGLFFGPDDIVEYNKMSQVPQNLRYYGASDHAVSTEQWADKTCLMIFGVDDNDDVWVMPETNLAKMPANTQVEVMINLIKKYDPLFWFAERGHITKSIGPFLRKRMQEERAFTAMFELTPTNDKQQRAQSIKGRMAAQKIHFPQWAAWYPEARRQILTFPAGAKDDFVDTLSMMGLGLQLQIKAKTKKVSKKAVPGTFGYLKQQSRQRDRRAVLAKQKDGW
jgi:predicted phage terminase large subunit-like protein